MLFELELFFSFKYTTLNIRSFNALTLNLGDAQNVRKIYTFKIYQNHRVAF
jgi:hypothetical protein